MLDQVSRPLKIVFMLVVVVALAFVLLTQKGLLGKKTSTMNPSSATSSSSQSETTTVTPSQAIFEEAGKQADAIQAQVNAGTLSPEEAQKKLEAIGAKLPTPPIPAEIQKQIDDAKKAQ